MVHRKIVHIICLLFLLSSSPLRGERGGSGFTHLPGIWIGVGDHSLLLPKAASSSPEGRPGGVSYGVEGLVGGDYAFTAGHFMMRIGGEFSVWHSVLPVADVRAELPHSVDKNGYDFTFVYDITHRRDAYTALGAQVPLMLGAEFGQFHFLVGGKFIYRYTLPASTSMQVSTYGDYPQFLDPFTGMPNHQYFDNTTLNRAPSPSPEGRPGGVDLAVSAELGWRLYPSSPLRGWRNALNGRFEETRGGSPALFLSLYADLGMLNYAHLTDAEPLILPESFSDREGEPNMVERLQVTPLLFSKGVSDAIVRNLSVGVKLSVRFPHTRRGKTYPCKCLQDSWTHRSFSDDF